MAKKQIFPGSLLPFTQACRGGQKSHRDLFIECVRNILSDAPTSAALKTWIHEAQDEGKLNALIVIGGNPLYEEDDGHKQKHPPYRM
jgi:hypothetical protein